MGPVVAVIYAILMVWAYGSQIIKLYKTEKTKDLSLRFFFLAWIAVMLRITTVGVIIRETWNITAIALEIAEAAVFFGLLIIIIQTWWYRRKNKTTQR